MYEMLGSPFTYAPQSTLDNDILPFHNLSTCRNIKLLNVLSSETEYLVIREAKKRTKSIPWNPQSDSWGEADVLCEISKVRREPTSTLALPKSHSLSWWVCGFTCDTYKYIFSILNILSQPEKN
jgi:hypothetical protein